MSTQLVLKSLAVFQRNHPRAIQVGDYSGTGDAQPSERDCPLCFQPMQEIRPVETIHRIVKIVKQHKNGDVDALVAVMPPTLRYYGCRTCWIHWTEPKSARGRRPA